MSLRTFVCLLTAVLGAHPLAGAGGVDDSAISAGEKLRFMHAVSFLV